MMQQLAHVALLVRDYDEALGFYTTQLGFTRLADTRLDAFGKRWVLVAPPGGTTALLLARAEGEQQLACVGNQTGGRVFLFLTTDDFWREYEQFRARGVRFLETPRHEAYALVDVFEDLYGNRWDLLQPTLPVARS